MFASLTQSSAWNLIVGVDWAIRFILLILFLLSVFCVAIILGKLVELRRRRRDALKVWRLVVAARNMSDLTALMDRMHGSRAGKLLLYILEEAGLSAVACSVAPDSALLNRLEISVERQVDEMVVRAERFLPILGLSAAVAPLVGLFGTIWGLIRVLMSMGRAQSADLTVVAPGIAEALCTTLVGLALAILVLVAYHYLSNQLCKIEWKLFAVTESIIATLRHAGGC